LEAILSGLLAGCIASPCVGPVLVSVLTFVAQTKSLFLGFWLLFVFAFGMGQLFLILGTSTRLADRLPRSGPWMIGIQKFFAICFFSLAAWYVSPLLSTALLYLVLALLMFAFCSVFGLFRKTRPQGVFQIMSRAMLAAGFLAAVYCSFRGATFFFNPAPQGSQQTSSFQWQTYSAETLANAVQNHRPVIVDFWADWCVACKELEYTTYSDTQIKTLSKDFVLLKFDATKSTPEFEKLKKTYGIMGLPFVGFYDSSGVLRPDLTLTGYEKAPLFLQRMRSAFQPNKAKDDLALPNH
jgi:thiol:disulfide interchange protein DsbD